MIQGNNLSKQFGPQIIFDDASFVIGAGEKVGFVGRNGSGKSTLFRMILGEETSDSGTISIPKNYKIGTLKQHLEFSKATVLEECAQILKGDEQYDLYKAEKILFGLGFTQEDLSRSPQLFSGGFQIRINLAKVLLQNPDMLLLDEPTNYLDIISLRWLSRFLQSFQGEVILITHDRDFMNGVTTHTMGISRRQLRKFKGPTHKYYEQIKSEEEIYEQTRENLERKRKEMEGFVTRFKAKASKATQAQSRVKALEKMEVMEKLEFDKNLGFKFNYKECPAKNLMHIESLSFGYDSDKILINDLSFSIGKNDRIGIIGKNGKGKSTLLNLLGKELTPNSGEIKSHPSLNIGHFGQMNISRLNESVSVVDEIVSSNSELSNTHVRSICGTMLFEGDAAKKKISVLSGGERSRVLLGKIIAHQTNLLLLDEPTNHLDMESIESLVNQIHEYKGAVAIVTHSEMILKRAVTKLVIFHKGGVEFFNGNYAEFLEKIGWEEEQVEEVKDSKKGLSRKELKRVRSELISERSKQLNPLKKKIEEIENRLIELEGIHADANQQLVDASSSGDGDKIVHYSKVVSEADNEMELLFEDLEQVSSQHDELEQGYQARLEELEER